MDKEQRPTNPFVHEYNEELQALLLQILGGDVMYPFYLRDPRAGTYKIIKTQKGKLQMTK